MGLYRGLPAVLIGITPEKTLKLTVNNYLRRWMKKDENTPLTLGQEALSGIGTGLVQVTITNPYELIKIRLQMQTGDPTKPKKGIVAIAKELGLRGMYTGLAATMFRDIPFNAIYFFLYALNKEKFKDKDGQLGPIRLLAAGAVAAGLAAAVDTPADCLKTRLQNGQNKYNGLWDCYRKTIATEGHYALLKGVEIRVLIIAPLFAITFATYETLQRIFAPGTRNKIDLFDEDFESLRKARIQAIASELKSEYGLELRM
jgi:solute carrier family 25 aspartate/glutamate transporter 12/13